MKYDEARPQIQDGDLIAVRATHGGLPALVRWFTRSPYTHTAIAIWLDSGLWISEMNAGGNVMVPLSHYAGAAFDVFDCPVERDTARRWTLDLMREPIDYDVLDLLRLACNRLIGLPLPADKGGRICSSFSAATYLWAGWKPQGLPLIPAPADVVAALGSAPKLTVNS